MFRDRIKAGERLAATLLQCEPAVVVALPRGGVLVALPVARALGAPLDLLLVRKLGAPCNPEVAVGAVAEGDPPAVVIDAEAMRWAGTTQAAVQAQAREALEEIERRRRLYLEGRERVPVAGRTVLLVDDGLATGTTARAAIAALRARHAARIVLAVPVAAAEAAAALRGLVDQLVCLETPVHFRGVGGHYIDFHQVSDDEVVSALRAAAPGVSSPGCAT